MDGKISYSIKIVLTGESGVGKTSFKKRLSFQMTPEPDFIDYVRKIFTVKDKLVEAIIWDTGGWEKFFNISNRYYYRGAKAAMLFYDITDLNSFNSLEKWLDDIHKYAEPNPVIMLIGSKCDSSDAERKVSTERGQNFAKQHNLLFYEISNRNAINIKASIMKLVEKTVSILELEER